MHPTCRTTTRKTGIESPAGDSSLVEVLSANLTAPSSRVWELPLFLLTMLFEYYAALSRVTLAIRRF